MSSQPSVKQIRGSSMSQYDPPAIVGSPATYKTAYGPFDITSSKSGYANPGWKRAVRAGRSATTNYTGNHWDFKFDPPGRCSIEWTPTIAPYKGLIFKNAAQGDFGLTSADFFYPLLSDSTAANNQALASLYSEIRNAQTQMSGLVFLGEMREALHMLRNPLQGLRKGMSDYLNRLEKVAKGRHTRKSRKRALQDTWLEYSFGWKPFIHDLKDAQKAFQRVRNRTQSVKVEAIGKSRSYAYHSTGRILANPNIWFRYDTKLVREIGVRYVAGLRDVTTGATDLSLSTSAFGLTLNEFVPTAWELLPYSFVVDYFTNAGAIISSFYTDTSGVTWLSKSVRSVVTQEGDIVFDQTYTVNNIGANIRVLKIEDTGPGHFEFKHKSLTRSEPILQLPTLSVTCPAIDSLRWVNLIALGTAQRKLVPYY